MGTSHKGLGLKKKWGEGQRAALAGGRSPSLGVGMHVQLQRRVISRLQTHVVMVDRGN